MWYRALLFALLIFGLNGFFGWAFEWIDDNAEFGQSVSSRLARLELNDDVLFIGDSRTHQGVDPRVFDRRVSDLTGTKVRSRNLGRPGMQTPFHYFTLQNYLRGAERPPKAVFLNVSYYLLNDQDWMNRIYLSGFEPTPDQVDDARNSGLLTPWAAASWKPRTEIPLLRHFIMVNASLMRLLNSDPMESLEALNQSAFSELTLYSSEYRGYAPRGDGFIEPTTRSVGNVFAPERAEDVYLDYFEKFVKLADTYDVDVFVYEFPWPESHRTEYDIKTITAYQKLLKNIGYKYDNFEFIDYEYFMDSSYFVDPLHLNNTGTGINSARLAGWYARASDQQ